MRAKCVLCFVIVPTHRHCRRATPSHCHNALKRTKYSDIIMKCIATTREGWCRCRMRPAPCVSKMNHQSWSNLQVDPRDTVVESHQVVTLFVLSRYMVLILSTLKTRLRRRQGEIILLYNTRPNTMCRNNVNDRICAGKR